MKVKNEYTQSLKRRSGYNPNNFSASGAAIFFIVLQALFFVVPLALQLTGAYAYIESLGGGDMMFVQLVLTLVSQGIVVFPALIYSLIKQVNPVSGGGYIFAFDFTPILFGCVLVAGLQLCFSPLHMQFSDAVTSFGGLNIMDEEITGNVIFAFLYILLIPILPCICEEIAFRGVIMRGLSSRFGGFAAVVISAAMFAVFHGNFQQLILQFLGGVAIGACMYITKNFALSVAMHFFNNLFAVGYAMLQMLFAVNEKTANLFTAVSAVIGVVLLIVGGYYFIKFYFAKKGYIKNDALYGRQHERKPVLMSAEHRAEYSSIVIDAAQVREFTKYYPDAMRYKRGGFVTLNKKGNTVAAVILIGVGLTLAVITLFLNQFGV